MQLVSLTNQLQGLGHHPSLAQESIKAAIAAVQVSEAQLASEELHPQHQGTNLEELAKQEQQLELLE